jgi:hypothetical protein
MPLWQMFGDKMGNHGRSLAELESPYFIFGGAVGLRQARVLAHVLGSGLDQGVAPRGPFQPPEVLHELGETHNASFRPGSRHFSGGRGGGGEHSRQPLHEILSGPSTFRNYTHAQPKFRALLTEGSAQQIDLARL